MSIEVKPHPLEDELERLRAEIVRLQSEADHAFRRARELDRQVMKKTAEADAVVARLNAFDREQIEEYERQQAAAKAKKATDE